MVGKYISLVKTNQQNRGSAVMMSALLLALFLGIVNCGYAWDYGNGRHGSYVLTTNTTIEQLYQTVRLTNDPAQYNPADSNAIPNFQNLTVTNGATLSANAWNGSAGGKIIIKVEASLSVAPNSTISVNGIGYRGGSSLQQGESYAGGQSQSTSANYGGGGGGTVYASPYGAIYYYAAGGGGYGSSGGNAYPGGASGSTYGSPDLSTNYMGSGGGGGVNSTGGNGGGSIEIDAGQILLNGTIQASGNSGGVNYYYTDGGGGSGGSVLLRVSSAILGTNNVIANGGSGISAGGGGVGRVAVYYAENYTGVTTPAASSFLNTNSDNVTVITNQPVPQTNFLAANVIFNVGVWGLPPLTFQWNFNGVPIPGATNQSLALNNIALTNTGNYSVTISNAVMTVVSSNAFLKVLDTAIPLGDGIPNWWKLQYGLSTNDPTLATNYPTGDKLPSLEKYLYGLNPLTNDTDGDGLTDYDEIFIYHTNPLIPNTAGDGIPDGWKVQYGINPLIADANNEAGFDGVTYLQIYQYNQTHTNQLNPTQPFAAGSGFSNFEIINNGLHTNRYYYDHEDRLLGIESSKGISIGYQYDGNGNLLRQSVLSRAAETNGLPVLWLWLNGLTNAPGIAYQSASGNGWDNYQEWLDGLNANSNNVPSLVSNPGTNIATLTVPFTPTNWVMASGQLNGTSGDEIVVGADGNPGTNSNSMFVLTQTPTNWSMQQISVGSYGITSVAIGQPTNRPSAGIYVGLRGTNSSGQVMEFDYTNGLWLSNTIAVSSNEPAFVGGIRQNGDLLANLGTNNLSGALWSVTFSNTNWNMSLLSSNASHTCVPSHGLVYTPPAVDASLRLVDANGSVEVVTTNVWTIPQPLGINPLIWRGLQLASGRSRSITNAAEIFYCAVNDADGSGNITTADSFVFAEYEVSNNTATTLTLTNLPVGSNGLAQSYAVAAVDYLGSGIKDVFTAEPSGAIYAWYAPNASAPLQRQLFSPDYAGQGWQALAGINMPAWGQGLAGVVVCSTNQNSCNVIFWQPQAVLPTPTPSIIETAPYAVVIPTNTSLSGNASINVRLWHNQGNASTPFVQFQFLGATNWQNATLTTLDGLPYYSTLRVAALPTGSTHLLTWNALGDVGANVVTNILLRASAQDFMLTGSWSSPTPFQLNTSIVTPPTNPPVNFTGTTPTPGGIKFNWQSGSNAWMYLQRSPALVGTNANWVNIWTGAPPTPISGSYTDSFGTNLIEFYRFKIVSP